MRVPKPSPAVLVAALATVVALGGTAVAGSLTGSKHKPHRDAKVDTQLFKKLLKKSAPQLSVKRATTATTAANAGHAANSDKLGGTAASGFKQRVARPGELETGIFTANGTGGAGGGSQLAPDAIEFDPPLAADLCVSTACYAHVGYVINTPSASCPGVGQAARGVLCLYESGAFHMSFNNAYSDPQSGALAIRKYGTVAYFNVPTPAEPAGYIQGTWAMRAP